MQNLVVVVRIQSDNMGLCLQGKHRRVLSKMNTKQCAPRGWRRSETSAQNLKEEHYFAAHQRATWKILSGSQVPNVKQCVKKTRKQGGWDTAFK